MRQLSDSNQQAKLLALALYQVRVLLASELDSHDKPNVQHAAKIAYALHNQALALIEDKDFDLSSAQQNIDRAEESVGAPGYTKICAERLGINWQA